MNTEINLDQPWTQGFSATVTQLDVYYFFRHIPGRPPRVFSFEPGMANSRFPVLNKAVNEFDQITLIHAAASDRIAQTIERWKPKIIAEFTPPALAGASGVTDEEFWLTSWSEAIPSRSSGKGNPWIVAPISAGL